MQVDVTQTEYHLHHGAWTTDHQEHGSSLAEEVSVVSQRQDRARSLKDILKRGKMFGLFSRGKNVKCQVAVLLSALKCAAE